MRSDACYSSLSSLQTTDRLMKIIPKHPTGVAAVPSHWNKTERNAIRVWCTCKRDGRFEGVVAKCGVGQSQLRKGLGMYGGDEN